MKKIYLLFTLVLGLTTASCDLDTESSTGLDPEEAIQSVKDLQNAVNGVYFMQVSEMPSLIDKYMGVRGSYAGDFTVYADLLGTDAAPIDNYNQISEIAFYTTTKSSNVPKDYYRRFYYSIARINKVFDLVKKNKLEGDDVQEQLGELYALRGMFHFDLARMFAKLPSNASSTDLGIVVAKRGFANNETGTRANIKDTYAAIIADLDTALMYLPEIGSSKLLTGHMNYWAVKSIRAKVFLYMEENTKAYNDAKDVVDRSPYSLYTMGEYTSVWEKEGTNESLMEFLVSSTQNAQRNSLGFYSSPDGYAEFGISETFRDIMLERPSDVRSKLIEEVDFGDTIVYFPKKYPGRNKEVYVNNPKVVRLSEVYLIAAEASLKSGEGNPAYYVNELRKNRIESYTNVGSVSLDDILLERRLELFAEGNQAWDAWRNKKSVQNNEAGEVFYNDYKTILPIPISEINISGGKLQQNTGY